MIVFVAELACRAGQDGVASVLVQIGAQVDRADEGGTTALHIAAEEVNVLKSSNPCIRGGILQVARAALMHA